MTKYLLTYFRVHCFQLARFTLVGLITFAIYFVCFHIFYGILSLDYRIGASLAYLLTLGCHFLLHRSFTFLASKQKIFYNIWRYALMLLTNYLFLMVIMWLWVNLVEGSPYLGVLMSTSITVVLNFFMMKYFVFESKQIR